jgi:hypothetical protein
MSRAIRGERAIGRTIATDLDGIALPHHARQLRPETPAAVCATGFIVPSAL